VANDSADVTSLFEGGGPGLRTWYEY